MGNSCGAMSDYTEYAYEEPLYQGGFVWDYIDQSIRTKDRYGNETFAYGGDFGGNQGYAPAAPAYSASAPMPAPAPAPAPMPAAPVIDASSSVYDDDIPF